MARGLDGAPLAATWLEDASGHAVSPEGRGICGARLSPRQEHDERLLLADAALVNERHGERHVDAVDAFFRLL
jgi:hypothetical protein